MKNLKKRLVALGLGLATMASSVMSVSASAYPWEPVDWPGAYTPSTGRFFANSSLVRVTDLYWPASDINNASGVPLKQGIEFEFRPQENVQQRPNGFHDIWKSNTSNTSNLPDAYFEFQPVDDDTDDVAICCGNTNYLVTHISYYGYMNLEKQPSFNSSTALPYTFESELGRYIPLVSDIKDDYVPLKGATYLDGGNNVVFGTEYSWFK